MWNHLIGYVMSIMSQEQRSVIQGGLPNAHITSWKKSYGALFQLNLFFWGPLEKKSHQNLGSQSAPSVIHTSNF
jgi:hypothetical protein